MGDEVWTEAEVRALYHQIRDELIRIFGHDESLAHSLLTDWFADHPDFSPDDVSHQGPFNMALRVHYAMVEGGDPTSVEFIEWRKKYHGGFPLLTPAQETLLRERGWDCS